MIDVLNKKNLVPWIAAILMFLQIEPYFVWPLHQYIVYYNTVPLMLILYNYNDFRRFSMYEYAFVLLSILAAICARYNILGIIMSAMLVLLFVCKKEFQIDVFLKFKKIYVIIIGLSMVVWTLLQLGVNVPHQTIPPLNSLKEVTYDAYPFLVKLNIYTLSYDGLSNSMRFMGPFDEPGVVGTISLMLLFVERFDLRKKENIVVFLSGIISFSLFFYVAAFVFLFYNITTNKNKGWYKTLMGVILASLVVYSFSNPITRELIWERLEWDTSRNTIVGDNRTGEDFDAYVESIRGTYAYFWGVGDSQISARFSGAASINNALIRYGLVVLVYFFVFYAFYSRRYIKSIFMWLAFMSFLYITLYQRPGFFTIYYLFIFNMAIYASSKRYQGLFTTNTHLVQKTSLRKSN